MPRNGSGVFSPVSPNYPAVSGTLITAANRNAVDADIATALTNSIAVNGESVVTNNIPFGGNKLTGVAEATARTDAASLATIQDGTGVYVATVEGTADVITITPSPAITAYVAGQLFSFIASGENTTNVTVNVNGLGAKAITKNGATALVAGDILSGFLVSVRYDGTHFQLGALSKFMGGTLTSLLTQAASADIASATTVDLTAATGNTVRITGTTPITAFTMNAGQQMELVAAGALPLTYHAATMNINGGASYTCAAGDRLSVFKDGSGVIQVNVTKQDGTAVVVVDSTQTSKILSISASVGASALTISTSALTLDFRSATLTSGTVTTVTGTPADLVISSGSTLGTIGSNSTATFATSVMTVTAFGGGSPLAVGQTIIATGVTAGTYISSLGTGTGGIGTYNLSTTPGTLTSRAVTVDGVQSRLAILALNNAGTIELATVNIAGGINLNETGVLTTVAEGGAGAADSATTVYSTTARTGVAYRVVGYVESTQATAGTWATAPSTIQGAGGQSSISTALNAQGTAPMFACRAWVNFNGTGTVSIRASGNVSSITDTGVGTYTVNLTNAMPNANYAKNATSASASGQSSLAHVDSNATVYIAPTTTSFAVYVNNPGAGGIDSQYINAVVF